MGTSILIIALVMMAIVLFLPMVTDGWSDPWTRYLLFLVVLVVLVLVLVRLTIPRGPEQGYPSPGQETGYEFPVGPVEGFMELAIKGQPYSQLNIYLELKHAFMLRVRTRRGLDEERWVYVLSNPGVMQRAINDPELYRFSLLEDKGTFDLEQYRRIGVVLGDGFLERYEQLLRKVEEWA